MNIPDHIVEAAARAHLADPWDTYSAGDQEHHLDVARTSLEAAADAIAAQALRDAAAQIRSDRGDPWAVGWLETRANTLDPS